MSSPLSNLKKGKKTPFGSRSAPYKQTSMAEIDLVDAHLKFNAKYNQNKKVKPVSEIDLMTSMMTRLSNVEEKLASSEELLKLKDKRICVLEEKCKLYKAAQGNGCEQVLDLQKKCQKLQNQVHSMEVFLEDYGMIWVGTGNSSDEEFLDKDGDLENKFIDSNQKDENMWKPDASFNKFIIDYDLVIKNIHALNAIAGEGEHYIKHTKDGARLQVKEAVPLTLYANGIFMFGGPFRPYEDPTTQTCVQDIMDGYFPTELQSLYPDGVPFKVHDKREIHFRDKHLEKLFPGEGNALSPEKARQVLPNREALFNKTSEHKTESIENTGQKQSLNQFLSKLPSSVIKSGKIVDIREGLKETLQDEVSKNNVIVIETDVVKEMKVRLNQVKKNRPPTPINVTTLRIKSETGDQTYLLKMKFTHTIRDVRSHIDDLRLDKSTPYEIKTSFPNMCYSDYQKTLKEYGLVPNATMYIVVRK